MTDTLEQTQQQLTCKVELVCLFENRLLKTFGEA